MRFSPIEGDEGVSWMLHSVTTPKRAVNSIRGKFLVVAVVWLLLLDRELKVNWGVWR
jgi:hypothetical protein